MSMPVQPLFLLDEFGTKTQVGKTQSWHTGKILDRNEWQAFLLCKLQSCTTVPQKVFFLTSQGRITHLAVSTTYTRIYPGMVGWGQFTANDCLTRRFRALRLANQLQPLQVSNGWFVALKG